MPARFDRRLISQALTNIIKNATEAIAAVPPAELGRGRIHVSVSARGRRHRHRRDRQRHRPAEGEPQPAARALCHHAREGAPASASPSSAAFWRSTAAASSCATPPENSGRARRLDAPALRRRAAPRRPTPPNPRRNPRSGERAIVMASDILIVDDEADIRELVAGILQDEGFETRTARDSETALNSISSRRPNLLFLDIWLQGSRLDGLQLLDNRQGAASRTAGGDDLRPRQHRDRGLGDQARRLRLHREAVQGRPAGAGREPRAGEPRGSSARSRSSSSSRRCRPAWSAARRRSTSCARPSRRSRRPTAAS